MTVDGAAWTTEEWAVPEVIELRTVPRDPELPAPAGDRLEWQLGDAPRRVAPDHTLLRGFVGLADAGDDAILAYARQWGPLWVTECVRDRPTRPEVPYGLRHAHNPLALEECRQHAWGRPWHQGWEPLAAWRQVAARARALLLVRVEMQREPPRFPEAEWAVARGYTPEDLAAGVVAPADLERWARGESVPRGPGGPPPVRDVEAARRLLAWELNQWRRAGDVRDVLTLTNGGSVHEAGDGLFGALVAEMTRVLTGSKHLARCDNCGNPYGARRRPRADQRKFCDECRDARFVHYKRAKAREGGK